MMLILSLIHSLIVSTNPGPEKQSLQSRTKRMKRRRALMTNARFDFKRISSDENLLKFNNPIKRKLSHMYNRKTKVTIVTQEKTKRVLDEGFESFNGNGSSENGDDTKDKNSEMKCLDDSLEQLDATKNKLSSDEHESDTDSEPVCRKRNIGRRISISKEQSDTDSDTQMTFKSVTSLVRIYFLDIYLNKNVVYKLVRHVLKIIIIM